LGDVLWWRTGKARITASAGILVAVAYGLSLVIPERPSWVFIGATALAAFPIARRAVAAAAD
jgi:Cd2+/Zn2+-exporting ATPase